MSLQSSVGSQNEKSESPEPADVKPHIVSLGSALQDIFLIDHDDLNPTQIGEEAIFGNILVGSKIDIDRLEYCVGGGGINSAITFSRQGLKATFIGNVGNDVAGEMLIQTLKKERIETDFINLLKTKTTGTSIILLAKKTGERTILTCRGASNDFSNLNPAVLKTLQPDWLYATTLRGDFATLKTFFKVAKRQKIKIMFNPGTKELAEKNQLLKLLSFVDILLVNKTEAMQIVPGVMMKELLYHLNQVVPTVIITDGKNGGGATNTKETYTFGIYEDVKIKDATGAGDAFGSGFLAAFAGGKSFRDCLTFASANSTAVVQKIGGSSGILNQNPLLHEITLQKI